MRRLGTLVLLVAACGVACVAPQGVAPPEMHYGEDLCQHCNMIVSEERFAAALIRRDAAGGYTAQRFDDIGCMLAAERAAGPDEVVASYVHATEDLAWLEARQATFVHSEMLQTPMLSGLAAWRDPAQAADAARRLPGRIVERAALLAGTAQPGAP